MTNQCNTICPRIAGLVQQLNSVHTLCSMGEYRKANEIMGMIQAQMQSAAHEIWLEYHVSGAGK